ncbi:hypothetical protein COLO4_07364 [Corchorus olitorius]|uniref:Uncharacterized protein n=1 Tax=Corchorus olitorius TaxID=93759 RepID=A0A1R3KK35_9ROSI|nr:hypothetical protein COLO4_07364 [Corchorus olitorius]
MEQTLIAFRQLHLLQNRASVCLGPSGITLQWSRRCQSDSHRILNSTFPDPLYSTS